MDVPASSRTGMDWRDRMLSKTPGQRPAKIHRFRGNEVDRASSTHYVKPVLRLFCIAALFLTAINSGFGQTKAAASPAAPNNPQAAAPAAKKEPPPPALAPPPVKKEPLPVKKEPVPPPSTRPILGLDRSWARDCSWGRDRSWARDCYWSRERPWTRDRLLGPDGSRARARLRGCAGSDGDVAISKQRRRRCAPPL